jgi:hypothetical protein
MGNQNSLTLSMSNKNFIDQIKADGYNLIKIIGIYLNPSEFTKSGLIVVTPKGKLLNKIKK